MGMDMVELIMAAEDEFQVELLDADFSTVNTAGDLHRQILVLLDMSQPAEDGACPCIAPFLDVRRVLMETVGAVRSAVRPSTALNDLLPVASRRNHWETLREHLHIPLPPLQQPANLPRIIVGLSVLLAVASAWISFPTWDGWILVAQMLCSLILLRCFFAWITRPLAVCFPARCQTVGDVVQLARPPRYRALRPHTTPVPSAEEVWERLVRIISDVLCVPSEEIHPHSRIVEDLGAD